MDELTIKNLTLDKHKFDAFVYTSLDFAISDIENRKNDPKLQDYIKSTLPIGIPPVFKTELRGALFRHLITPNYELRRFMSIMDAYPELSPLLCEFTEDKFTSNNELKYTLGKLGFHIGTGKKGGDKVKRVNIIDFNLSNGRKLSEVKTLWGQNLCEFHKELLFKTFPNYENNKIFDSSDWFKKSGNEAKIYYENLLKIFLSDGILFENFTTKGSEKDFTSKIFLPAFIKIYRECGWKPLIVALEPTNEEADDFWMRHPYDSYPVVKEKLGL